MREVFGVFLALVAEGLAIMALTLFAVATSCWFPCGPSGSAPLWQWLVAVPFAGGAFGLMFYAAHLFMPPGTPSRKALEVGIGSTVGFVLVFLVVGSVEADGAMGGLLAVALLTGWAALTAFAAGRVADRA